MTTTAIANGVASGLGRECTSMLLKKGLRLVVMGLQAEAITSALPDAGDALIPTGVETPMSQSWPQAVKDGAAVATRPSRLARPDDVANVAYFLASDAAGFVTGEVDEVNGVFCFR